MRVFALDLASTTGYAVLAKKEDGEIVLVRHGTISREQPLKEYGEYPWSYQQATEIQATAIVDLLSEDHTHPSEDVIVVEETNQTKGSRYAQKYLEFLHSAVLRKILGRWGYNREFVSYISTGDWKRALGIKLSKEQQKQNRRLKEIKDLAIGADAVRTAKKAAGIKGKVTSKHLSVAYVNQRFGLDLAQKDDDIADAICLGEAYLKGAKRCDGT